MPTLKSIGIAAGLVTSISGIAGGVAYTTGIFSSNTQIIALIKKENKHTLLTLQSSDEEWKIPWETYKGSDKKWGEFTSVGDAVPDTFKKKCSLKSKEVVYGVEDTVYKEVTKYCARDKTIADILGEQNFALLNTKGEEAEWKTRFDKYKEATNLLKLKDVVIQPNDNKETHYTKLRDGCQKTVQIKTKDANYEENIPAIKKWCKNKE